MARIVVCGYMVRHPVVGLALAYFQYVLGLQRLGHDVLYLEESGWPKSCYDPIAGRHTDDPTAGLQVVRDLANRHGAHARVCYVNRESGEVHGTDWQGVKSALRAADLLLNVGGVCWLPEFKLCDRRVLVDMDPFFTQVGQFAGDSLQEHQVHFTYGANIGDPSCSIPTIGVDWIPTVPPVITDLWPSSRSPTRPPDRLTTVAHWSAYGAVTHEGERYGQKDEEFLRFSDLPRRVSQELEIAVSGIGSSDERCLLEGGWHLRDATEISTVPERYHAYLTGSLGEFSVAKNAYVKTHSGWFSDRSVCYLAAGCPVILQETGFSDTLPTGRGLLSFSTADEAVRCIDDLASAHETHRIAAQDMARRFFSHEVVLPRLVELALGARGPAHPSALRRQSH